MTELPRVWAVVPVKSLDQGKSRLSAILKAEERAALSFNMLGRVMEALRSSSTLQGWMVVSSDETVLRAAGELGGHPLWEEEVGLNPSLRQAAGEVVRLGGDTILVIPADVPLLSPGEVDALISLSYEERLAVIAPSRRRDGTNALLLRPPDLIPFSFGPGSFETHLALARRSGAPVYTYASEALAFDVDTEDDWRELAVIDGA